MDPSDEIPVPHLPQDESPRHELDRLRRLLLGREFTDTLESLVNKTDTERTAETISEAITRRHIRDQSVGEALGPIIDDALTHSIRSKPQRIIYAIYPIIGPVIRKAVAQALTDMVQTLNRLLENSLSLRAWNWRFNAWRAGMNYGEYVLLKTLDFRVEQVLLIHRETGILLHAEHGEGVRAEDPELISSMLTAIRDFVTDSFPGEEAGSVENIRVGDFILQIEAGPSALLVAAVRGTPSEEVGKKLLGALERIHRMLGRELSGFEGNRAPFASTSGILRSCLIEQRKYPERKKFPWLAVAILSALVVLGCFLGFRSLMAKKQFLAIREEISRTPGYLVTDSIRKQDRAVFTVLRSPSSIPPTDLIGTLPGESWQIQIRDRVAPLDFSGYLVPLLSRTFGLGNEVDLSVRDDMLTVRGTLTEEQLRRLRESPLVRSAFRGVDASRATLENGPDIQIRNWNRLKAEIESVRFQFQANSAELDPGMEKKIPKLVDDLKEINQLAETIPVGKWQLFIIGYADSTGTEIANQFISEKRAQLIRELLAANGVTPPTLLAWGVGHKAGFNLPEKSQRMVTLQLVHEPLASGKSKNP